MSEINAADVPDTTHGPEARFTVETPQRSDSMPAARLGMWLFLSSESMFFTGLLGALIVLGSGEQHQLFVRSSHMLSQWVGILSVLALIASSALMLRPKPVMSWASLAAAFLFIALQATQGWLLSENHTIVYRQNGSVFVQDGLSWKARKLALPEQFDVHKLTTADFATGTPVEHPLPSGNDNLLSDNDYGPSRNNFFASYYVLTGAHVAHLLAGVLALLFFLIFRNGKVPGSLQIYWHFMNATGIVALLALYFV